MSGSNTRHADIAAQLLELAPQVRGMVTRFIQEHAAELKLSMLEFDVLRSIEPSSPWMKELASRMVISAPAASKIVERLVDKGFVRREEDRKDRRAKLLSLTPAGARALDRARTSVSEIIDEFVREVGMDEQEELRRGLAALLTAIRNHRTQVTRS